MAGMDHDVIIVGGSYAGMAAALQLARARRSVLVVDAGLRRNRFAQHAQGFLGQDGRPPGEIADTARRQLLAYPTVTFRQGTARAARVDPGGFAVELEDGGAMRARRLILAVGVHDRLPDIPGLEERWGVTVFHCPYCHGYELGGAPIAVLAASELSLHQAMMLPDWGPTTLLLNDAFVPDDAQRAQLSARGVSLEAVAVERVTGDRPLVHLRDGRRLEFAGLFVATAVRPAGTLAEDLGCELAIGPAGEFLKTDEQHETSVRGVFACGDAAVPFGSVSLAVGSGAMAGIGAHRSLVYGALK